MTREEAKKVWDKVHPLALDLNTVIDTIYDDFENRSCKNCKYYEETIRKNVTICTKLNTDYGKDFCCNKYKAKAK